MIPWLNRNNPTSASLPGRVSRPETFYKDSLLPFSLLGSEDLSTPALLAEWCLKNPTLQSALRREIQSLAPGKFESDQQSHLPIWAFLQDDSFNFASAHGKFILDFCRQGQAELMKAKEILLKASCGIPNPDNFLRIMSHLAASPEVTGIRTLIRDHLESADRISEFGFSANITSEPLKFTGFDQVIKMDEEILEYRIHPDAHNFLTIFRNKLPMAILSWEFSDSGGLYAFQYQGVKPVTIQNGREDGYGPNMFTGINAIPKLFLSILCTLAEFHKCPDITIRGAKNNDTRMSSDAKKGMYDGAPRSFKWKGKRFKQRADFNWQMNL